VSSILQALKELEGKNAPVTPETTAWSEERPAVRRAAETFGIIAAGLIIGALGFLVIVWLLGSSVEESMPVGAAASASAVASVPRARAVPAPARPGAAPPAWLARTEPPRGMVAGATPGSSTPTSPATARTATQDAPPVATDSGDIAVRSIRYASVPGQRSVTLQIGGSTTTLREGQSVGDLEILLIMPDAVYVRQGTDVIMLTPGG
jgi:hypothetical protein